MVVLNWTCVGCGRVNFLSVEQQHELLNSKFNPKYPATAEIIQCEKCRSQVSIQARTPIHDTGR